MFDTTCNVCMGQEGCLCFFLQNGSVYFFKKKQYNGKQRRYMGGQPSVFAYRQSFDCFRALYLIRQRYREATASSPYNHMQPNRTQIKITVQYTAGALVRLTHYPVPMKVPGMVFAKQNQLFNSSLRQKKSFPTIPLEAANSYP
jgi:hypothetical protein